MANKFQVKKTNTGYNFLLIAANGQPVGSSQVYKSLKSATAGCEAVKNASATAEIEDQTKAPVEEKKNPKFVIYLDKAGEFRFKLQSSNGQNILASEGYTTLKACQNGIASVVKNAAESEIELPEEEEEAAFMPHKEVGFVTVSIGDGLGSIFRELGADYVIEGGQTMNPSTQDIMDAVAKVNADSVFILPNNKNIILAAEQAQNLIHDKEIIVIPSKTIPQGITALVNYLPDKSVQENAALMKDEIRLVKTVELTYAVRDTKIDEKMIHAGDIMGVADSGIVSVGTEVCETAFASVKELVDDESELISVYYGKDVSEEDAEALGEKLREEYPDCEVEIASGGQPLYYYIISIE